MHFGRFCPACVAATLSRVDGLDLRLLGFPTTKAEGVAHERTRSHRATPVWPFQSEGFGKAQSEECLAAFGLMTVGTP